jgi:Transposase DDE domain
MARHHAIYDWSEEVIRTFDHCLSRPQATVLAYYSFGVVLAQRCGLNHVCMVLVPVLGAAYLTLRSRLQEFYQPAHAKSASQGPDEFRRSLDVTACFGPLLNWVLAGWPSTRLALALDATSLADRLTVLSISVVYRGCALPVAWKVLHGNTPHAWKPELLKLLDDLGGRVPKGWTVIVMTDRGLYSRWLFRAITKLGWHPLMRVTANGKFLVEGKKVSRWLKDLVSKQGQSWQGCGVAFPSKSERRLSCTLLACWEPGQKEAWFVLTDLPPDCATVLWYGMRYWIEHGFKLLKSDGWNWQRSRMTDPDRVERLWLVLAVATRYVLMLGGEVEDGKIVIETIPELPPNAAKSPTTSGRSRAQRKPHPAARSGGAAAPAMGRSAWPEQDKEEKPETFRLSGTKHRLVSIFCQGLMVLAGLIAVGQQLPSPSWSPEPWLELGGQSDIFSSQPPAPVPRNPSL